jgi:hypothetical protein
MDFWDNFLSVWVRVADILLFWGIEFYRFRIEGTLNFMVIVLNWIMRREGKIKDNEQPHLTIQKKFH